MNVVVGPMSLYAEPAKGKIPLHDAELVALSIDRAGDASIGIPIGKWCSVFY